MGTMCPSEVPSFVYRQDGHELSYLVVMGIVHETGRKVKGDKRAAVSGFSHQTSDAGPDEFGMTQPLDKLEFGGESPLTMRHGRWMVILHPLGPSTGTA